MTLWENHQVQCFSKGETIIRRGSLDTTLFFMDMGSARVSLKYNDIRKHKTNHARVSCLLHLSDLTFWTWRHDSLTLATCQGVRLRLHKEWRILWRNRIRRHVQKIVGRKRFRLAKLCSSLKSWAWAYDVMLTYLHQKLQGNHDLSDDTPEKVNMLELTAFFILLILNSS